MWQLHDNTLLFGLCNSVVLEDVWSTRELVCYSVFDFKAGVVIFSLMFFLRKWNKTEKAPDTVMSQFT